MPLAEPLGGLPGLQGEVMLARPNLHLHALCLRRVRFRLDVLLLLVLLVLELPVVHNLRHGRRRRRGNLDEVEPGLLRAPNRFVAREDAEGPPVRSDNPQFRGSDALVYPYAVCLLAGISQRNRVIGNGRYSTTRRYGRQETGGKKRRAEPRGWRAEKLAENGLRRCAALFVFAGEAVVTDPDALSSDFLGGVGVCDVPQVSVREVRAPEFRTRHICLTERGAVQTRSVKICTVQDAFDEECSSKEGVSQVCISEIDADEARPLEIHPCKVYPTKVRLARNDDAAQVEGLLTRVCLGAFLVEGIDVSGT